MKEITAKRSWTTKAGTQVTAAITLSLAKTINADGYKMTVDCCELGPVIAYIPGHMAQYGLTAFPAYKLRSGTTVVGCIGKLALSETAMGIVDEMIAEVKSHPAWAAKERKVAEHDAMMDKLDAERKLISAAW